MKRAGLFALLGGFIAAMVCLVLAFFLSGSGHGWNTPLRFSLGGFITYPVGILVLLSPKRSQDAAVYGFLLALALAGDYGLYVMSDAEGWEYFHRAAPLNFIWLATWSLWQLAILWAFIAVLRKRFA